jgi:hypothetical protein
MPFYSTMWPITCGQYQENSLPSKVHSKKVSVQGFCEKLA